MVGLVVLSIDEKLYVIEDRQNQEIYEVRRNENILDGYVGNDQFRLHGNRSPFLPFFSSISLFHDNAAVEQLIEMVEDSPDRSRFLADLLPTQRRLHDAITGNSVEQFYSILRSSGSMFLNNCYSLNLLKTAILYKKANFFKEILNSSIECFDSDEIISILEYAALHGTPEILQIVLKGWPRRNWLDETIKSVIDLIIRCREDPFDMVNTVILCHQRGCLSDLSCYAIKRAISLGSEDVLSMLLSRHEISIDSGTRILRNAITNGTTKILKKLLDSDNIPMIEDIVSVDDLFSLAFCSKLQTKDDSKIRLLLNAPKIDKSACTNVLLLMLRTVEYYQSELKKLEKGYLYWNRERFCVEKWVLSILDEYSWLQSSDPDQIRLETDMATRLNMKDLVAKLVEISANCVSSGNDELRQFAAPNIP
jgi:hypothetical protein